MLKSGQNEYIDPEEEGGNVFVVTPGIEYTYSCIREGYIVTSSRFTPVVDQTLNITMEKNSGSGYTEQGFSNTLTLLNPGASQIEVVESATDADGYFYNRITKSLDNTKDLTFGFTMGAGINAFNEDFFLEQNMPQIGVYQYDGVGKIGKEMATEKNGKLSYVGFADREITISVEAGTLPDGTYILYFGKDICGNNANKTLGVPVMFEFKIGDGGSSTGGGGGGGGTTGGNTGNDNNNTNNGNQGTGNNTGNETGTGFNDVKTTDWYADAVAFVVEEKLFEGTSANAFEPNSAMTRSMLVTVLGRMNGGEIKGNASFTDVAAGAWYTDSIAWAADNGIVNGVGDGQFAPNQSITREELAVMMYNYAKFSKADVSNTSNTEVAKLADYQKSSAWAQTAMAWAYNTGLIQGDENNLLNPQGTATRAEVATILQRYLEK